MRNGFKTEVDKVKDFNRKVMNHELKDRALGNIYIQLTLKGNFRKAGYVAYDYNRTAFGFTKKEALERMEEMDKMFK